MSRSFLPLFTHSVSKLALLSLIFGTLTSCQQDNTPSGKARVDERASKNAPISSVLDMFSCKPTQLSFVAAHRGTVNNSAYPENALQSLQALHAKGIPFAEIDVARLKDGTQILFHDGTWERRTTGSGPIAASDWEASQKLLLKDTNGNISAVRPSRFSDVLHWAKNKMYLEIDFKSSVDQAKVVKAIHDADMIDQVILISYTTDQAVALHKLAPSAALSVGIFKPGDIKALEIHGIPTNVMTAWTGRGPLTEGLAKALRDQHIPILAASFFSLDDELQKSGKYGDYVEFAKLPDLVVTDQAFIAQQALAISEADIQSMEACLANK